jgi:hypothetical protein
VKPKISTMRRKCRELGILFLHHEINSVVRQNLASVRRQNPRAEVVTMSAGHALPNGYSLAATPDLQKLHAANPARSGDWLVCSWFVQRSERCRKWWIIEWDVFCAMPVRKYYRPVWQFPFVASSIRLRFREPEWFWFGAAKRLPGELQPYAMGAVPLLFLLSDWVLRRICGTLMANPTLAGNAELRFCTAANFCGYPPCGYSPPHDRITWVNIPFKPQRGGIHHPVKHLIKAAGTSPQPPAKISA